MGAVAAWSTSCTARPGSSPPAAGPAPSSPAPAAPPDWNALRARLSGGLVLPGDAGYETARRSFNVLFDARKPAAVAACARPEDVQACVETARQARLPLAARSGGHSYAGYSTPDGGLVADLSRMSGVRVASDGTAEIGAGTKLIDVYAGLAKAGRCLPGGSCPSVGIAGLTLGGGIGVLMRKFGLTCDRLVSARIVTADGTLRTASAESEPDLFWALRGGGGGNLGIVTSFTFATEPAPDLTVFSLHFPAGATSNVLGAWQQWIAAAPDELWSNCVISAGRPPTCRVGGCYVGSPASLNSLLDSFLAKTSARPDSRSAQPKGFLDAMRYFAACSQRTVEQCRPQPGGQLTREGYVATSRMLPHAADPAHLVSTVDGRSGVDLLLDSFGGAVSRLAPDATAFAHRTALASAQIYATATTATRDQATRAVTEVRAALTGITSDSAYVNYIDPDLPDWPTAYYGANLARLRTVARKYDPDSIFTFAQSLHQAH
ncbi:MAG TPA: FAD-binding oxidoreductase [Actinophytocola sp.]|uniref:FAD-binding oxidoreductase n=1 Tax=Actinophytocola sp. TaxID=1872138 RepID=UPI002E0496EB|nr:FAD-binding oxidoreductase [Actinophytocola sp.]